MRLPGRLGLGDASLDLSWGCGWGLGDLDLDSRRNNELFVSFGTSLTGLALYGDRDDLWEFWYPFFVGIVFVISSD